MLLKKLISVFTVLVFLTTLFPAVMLFARDIKPVPEGLMEAPLNQDFIEYMNNPPEVNYGYIPPPFDLSHLKNIIPKNYVQAQALPSKFDWREHNDVTSVKDQGLCGTCWIFGTTSVLESKALINEGVPYDFSEQSIALCTDRSWTYLYDGPNDPCMAGGWSWLAAETFIRKGAKLESCSPYTPSTLSCDRSCLEDSCPGIKRVNGYRLVTNDGSQLDLIKQAIYSNGPVTGAFYYNSTYLYNDPTFGYFYDCPTTSSTNHLISIVGWDDSVPHMNTTGTGAWIVKNSWGTSWGNSGYFYLAYNSSSLEEISYLLYEDYNTSQTLYSWDESTMNSSLGYGDNDAWMASVYTSQVTGQLKKVEFWVPSANASYQLYIYDGKFGSTLLAQNSGTLQEMGYYSIPLSTPVNLSQGQAFTVMVKLNTPGYNYPIPIEYVGSVVQPPIQSGVTFIRNNDGDGWWDTSNNACNVCLRAVVETTPPAIHLTYPNGGETLTGGSSYSVQWTISGDLTKIDHISVDYSTDGGTTWTYAFSVASGFSSSMSKSWTVPNVSSTNCKLKIALKRTDTTWSVDYSDNVFTIQAGLPLPTVTLTSPNGSETLTGGSSYSVQWTISGDLTKIDHISVDYSTDGGTTWTYAFSVASGFSSSMSKSWTVPNVSSTNCKLKIALKRTDTTWSVDYSDNVFTIQAGLPLPTVTLTSPNGSETLTGGSSYSVQWTISGDLTKIDHISVDYSTDGGTTWTYAFSVASGFSSSMSKSWTVPNVSSTNCKLKIALKRTDTTWSVDYSDNVFTIQAGLPLPTVTLTSPNGSETLTGGSSYSVQWTISGDLTKIDHISVDYSTDGGTTWTYAFSVASGFSSSMSKSWTAPNVSSTNCKLKIALKRTDTTWSVDYSDNVFTIQVTP